MIKALIGLLVAAIAAAFIRAVMAMITKEVKEMVNPEAPPKPQPTALKKCPVCGTYSPADRQYCSEACASKAQ
jgi:hypothetical protein